MTELNAITDIHSHIIPGVDDGSKTFEMTKNMLDIAYSEGTRGIILTPHHNPYRWKNTVETLHERYSEIRDYCEGAYPDMEIYLGNEIYYFEETLNDLESGKALYIPPEIEKNYFGINENSQPSREGQPAASPASMNTAREEERREGASEEPPKRKRGRPKGSKNKSTLEREAREAEEGV